MEKKDLATWDWVIIGVYFLICLSIGIYSKFRQKKHTIEEYFLAGRSMIWLAVGTSLYASNMGSEHFIGLAGSGASTGIAVVAYEWHASWVLLLLGYFFVPIYIRSGIYTMPEYLKCRFQSKWMRIYLTVVSLVSYITTKIAVDLYAGSLFSREVAGVNIYLSSFILLFFTATYTVLGGLSAVIYTDFIQCVLMIAGSLTLTILGFNEVGGIDGLWKQYPFAVGKNILSNTSFAQPLSPTTFPLSSIMHNNTLNSSVCYDVDKRWDHIFRPVNDRDFPWIGVIFSLPITGIWYWCTDQVIVQRTLGAKNLFHARAGTVLAGFLKLLPLFIMIMPGMIARVLFPEMIACPDAASCKAMCGNELGCSNLAFPELVLNILPQGLVGLMLSVMIAALMSSLSSAFNSASTIFTIDIWKVIRPSAPDTELLWVGRIVIMVLAAVGIAWIPVVQSGGQGQLFTYLQTIQSYLAPPTCAVFIVGMLWPKLTEVAALSSMLLGLFLGIIRLALDIVYAPPRCGEKDLRPMFVKLHFMYYALVIFFVCIIVMGIVSIFTRPVPMEMLGSLTWQTIDKAKYVEADSNLIGMNNSLFHHTEQSTLYKMPDNANGVQNFEEQSKWEKWLTWSSSGLLIAVLLFLWIYYR